MIKLAHYMKPWEKTYLFLDPFLKLFSAGWKRNKTYLWAQRAWWPHQQGRWDRSHTGDGQREVLALPLEKYPSEESARGPRWAQEGHCHGCTVKASLRTHLCQERWWGTCTSWRNRWNRRNDMLPTIILMFTQPWVTLLSCPCYSGLLAQAR